ncbi:Fic family protein, partial [PVC group bacterium]|nr:Fic family protein [PVC group bacterium]
NNITTFDANSIHSFIFKDSNIATGTYRKHSVAVGDHIPPDGIYIPELIQNIFPVSINDNLKTWYSLFQTIHPYEDGNGRVGGVIIATLSKLKSGRFLTPKQ